LATPRRRQSTTVGGDDDDDDGDGDGDGEACTHRAVVRIIASRHVYILRRPQDGCRDV
jgi:hypothetical protein